MTVFSRLRAMLGTFRRDHRGGVGIVFALAIPTVSAMMAGGVEYSNMNNLRAKMQAAADTAALSAVRELRFANASTNIVERVSNDYAKSAMLTMIGDTTGTIGAAVNNQAGTVTVTITRNPCSAARSRNHLPGG
jgi:Flp pilus assembly protein TadG